MFPQRYFAIRHFTPKYWPPGVTIIGEEVPIEFRLAMSQYNLLDLMLNQQSSFYLTLIQSEDFNHDM